MKKLKKMNKNWNNNLTPEQNYILKHEGTEPPGSSHLNNEKRKGSYHCAGCDAMPNEKHDHFYEDEDAFKKHKKDQLTFHFGIYQFAWDPDRIDPTQNVNSVVYKKDIVVKKIN